MYINCIIKLIRIMIISFLNKENNNFKIILFSIYYIFFLIAFFLNENSNGGALQDYSGYKKLINLFINDFSGTLLTFDQYGERHSPVLLILLTIFYKSGLNDELIRFIFFNFSVISIFFFYKCLKIKFKKTLSNYLFLIALILFLSPVFRSLSVWPDSRIFGFHFFIISVYFYLKYFNEKKKIIFCYLNVLFLAISSYLSINFCVFGIFFFYKFFNDLYKNKKLLNYILINIFLAFPAFYYLFILDVFFIHTGATPGNDINVLGIRNNFNIANKILIINGLIFFYLLPFFLYLQKTFLLKELKYKELFLLISFSLINIYLFNYKIEFTGGGIFFQISNFLFSNNILLYLVSIYAIFIV